MGKFVCELCGGTNLIKEEGMFVCQDCGAKYSVEEAKKLMNESSEELDNTNPEVQNNTVQDYSAEKTASAAETESGGTQTVSNSQIQGESDEAEDTQLTLGASAKTENDNNTEDYDLLIESANSAFNCNQFELAFNYYEKANKQQSDDVVALYREALSMMGKEYMLTPIVGEQVKRQMQLAFDKAGELSEDEKNEYAEKLLYDLDNTIENCVKKWGEVTDYDNLKYRDKLLDELIVKTTGVGDKNTQFTLLYNLSCRNNTENRRFLGFIENCVEIYPEITISKEEQKRMVTENNYIRPMKTIGENIYVPSLEALKMLIDMGADINVKDSQNVNILFYIVAKPFGRHDDEDEFEQLEKVKLLVENGAEIDNGDKVYTSKFADVTFLNNRTYPSVKDYIISVKPELRYKVRTAKEKDFIGDVLKSAGFTTQKSSSGCYVATAVYGSYDCPQVWTLRRYRDYKLSENWYGRLFIKIYYTISPTLVKWFGKTQWFKNMWRGSLDKMVNRLQDKGYESTPYIDKNINKL